MALADFPETRISLILRLAERSDVLAWQEFVELYAPALLAVARQKGLQPADAEDLAQEILFAVARAIHRFKPDASRARFRTWLSRIARNLIADHFAARNKRPISQAISDSWLRGVDGDDASHRRCLDNDSAALFQREFRSAMVRLAARRVRQRVATTTWTAFEQTCLLGCSASESARDTGLSLGGVYVARCRVLKLLRTEVQLLAAEELRDAGLSTEDVP